MKPSAFQYLRPETLDEALAALAENGDDAKVLAGGQSLIPMLAMRLAEPAVLIDLGAIHSLRQRESRDDSIIYGSGTTHYMVEVGIVEDAREGLLARAASGIGYRAIRARGTMGGSLAHSDSSAEWPLVLAAVDGHVEIQSAGRTRTSSVRELLQGFLTTTLTYDEIITAVRVPRPMQSIKQGVFKFAKKPGEFAESLAVALIELEPETNVVASADLWLGAAKDVPVQLTCTATTIAGKVLNELDVRGIREGLAEDLRHGRETDVDVRHQMQIHATTVLRAVHAATPDGVRR